MLLGYKKAQLKLLHFHLFLYTGADQIPRRQVLVVLSGWEVWEWWLREKGKKIILVQLWGIFLNGIHLIGNEKASVAFE